MPRPCIHIVDDLPHPIAFNASLLHMNGDLRNLYYFKKIKTNRTQRNRDNAGNRRKKSQSTIQILKKIRCDIHETRREFCLKKNNQRT